MAIAENKDGVAVPIETPVEQVKSVPVNVTLPADVLSEIDQYADFLRRLQRRRWQGSLGEPAGVNRRAVVANIQRREGGQVV
jgi:hypothetical protein